MDYTANEENTDRGRDTKGFGCERVTRYPEVIPGLAPSVDDMWGSRTMAPCRASSALQPRAVVDGLSEPLRASQVSLGGLDGHVAEQKLNLLQLAACCVAETSTCATLMPNAA